MNELEWMEMFTTVKHELGNIDSVIVLGHFDGINIAYQIWIEQRVHRDDLWRWVIPNVEGAYGDCRTLTEAKEKSAKKLFEWIENVNPKSSL